MSSDIALKSAPVTPLPIGSGGSSKTAQNMNNMNEQLTMMSVQSVADTKYDPPVPQPAKPAQIIQGFSSHTMSLPQSLLIVGVLCIVYGCLAK